MSFANRQPNRPRFNFTIQLNWCWYLYEIFNVFFFPLSADADIWSCSQKSPHIPHYLSGHTWDALEELIGHSVRIPDRSFNFHAVVFSDAPLSQPHSRGRPDGRPSSRGHRRCPSHAAVADHRAERRVLRGVITSLQLLHSTFFAALRPANQIFHVSWHAPSTHK